MHARDSMRAPSAARLWTGRVLTTLAAVFLLLDAIFKFLHPPQVLATFTQLGWPAELAVTLGVLQLICLILYLVPRTAILGAVLLTGYLGGAIATNLRVGNPLFTHILFPIYLSVFIWGGLYLRDTRVRTLIS
ncbi:MAG: DoxX family protein [Gemmatimonadaceae bacterium]